MRNRLLILYHKEWCILYGIIYKVTNLINQKIYIGQTAKGLEERRYMHEYESKKEKTTKIFHKAIKKYGKENFSWEIIDTALSKEELIQKEIDWIRRCNTYIGFDNHNGYNMTTGGEGGGYAHTEETKKLLSEMKKGIFGVDHPMYGRHHTDDTKDKMRNAHKGIKKTIQHRENMSKGRIGIIANSKSVVQLSSDGVYIATFSSAKEAKDALHVKDASCITRCCKGERKTAYGFKWMYLETYETLRQMQ